MIPRVSSGGHSFKGAYMYFGHDKESLTRERVAWSHTENLLTADPDKAWKVMSYTAMEQDRLKQASGQKATGRRLTRPVFVYSLAWHPEQKPDRAEMLEAARKSLAALGMSEHQTLMLAHRDEPHAHLHIMVNRVHPRTGLAADLSHTKRKLSAFASAYEREHGKIYCEQREKNHERRQRGENTKYRDPVIQEAWKSSDDGRTFAAALKDKEYQLAQGDKCIVAIDPHGRVHSVARNIKGVRERDVRERLGKDTVAQLPRAADCVREVQKGRQAAYFNQQALRNAPREVPAGKDGPAAPSASIAQTKAPEVAPAPQPNLKEQFGLSAAAPDRKPVPPPVLKEEFKKANPFTPSPEMVSRLQNQQMEEWHTESIRHEQRIERERRHLADHYQIEEKKKSMAELEKKLKSPSLLRRFFGLARRDQEKLDALRKTYDNAQQRMGEQIGFLEKGRKQAMESLAEKHSEEKKLLHERGYEGLREYRTQYNQKQTDKQRGLSR